MTRRATLTPAAGVLCLAALLGAATVLQAQAQQVAAPRALLWQTNAEGNDIHIFDLGSGRLVKRLEIGPEPHALAATADHRTVFVTIEANDQPEGELLWIDAATFEVRRRLRLCREPHALAVTPDGRFLYVPCRDGHYWIVDGETARVVDRIRTGGRPHNTAIAADGSLAYLSPMHGPHAATVVDVPGGHKVVGKIAFDDSLRPSALSRDGRWFFQHVDGLNGFQVADTRARKVAATVRHRRPLGGALLIKRLGWLGVNGFERCHGLGVRPDQQEIWSVCADRVTIHGLDVPGFEEVASVALPAKGYWITFSPDGRYACVALSDAGEVAVIDTRAKSIIGRFKAGAGPKRNLVLRHVP